MVGRVRFWRCVCLSVSVSVGLSGWLGVSLEVCLYVSVSVGLSSWSGASLEVRLSGLRLCDGAVTLLATRLTLLVACSRCRAVDELQLNASVAGELYTLECARCHSALLLQLRAVIAHGTPASRHYFAQPHSPCT